MKTPWLAEFYRLWHSARGRNTKTFSRAFSISWTRLLDSAKVTRAEDEKTAQREVESLEKSGHFIVKRHRYRKYKIESIALPPEHEPWLLGLFGGTAAADLQAEALEIVAKFSAAGHSQFPAEWEVLCESLQEAFSQGRSLLPFRWSQPTTLLMLLDSVRKLSETDWPTGTLIRNASLEIGLGDKGLERHQATYESGLARLFGTPVSLKSLGIAGGDSHVEVHGPLCLHFPDGSSHDFEGLSFALISTEDLMRCSSISTTADRLLTIENRKTTFRQYAAANHDRRTLIATTSFPTPAFREFLEKLPSDLPHHHFGDTDTAGWHILLKLREATPRSVIPFQMKWRPASEPIALTPYDLKFKKTLLSNEALADVAVEIRKIHDKEDRGNFLQETIRPPVSSGWPFGA